MPEYLACICLLGEEAWQDDVEEANAQEEVGVVEPFIGLKVWPDVQCRVHHPWA